MRKLGVKSVLTMLALVTSGLVLAPGADPVRAQSSQNLDEGRQLVEANCGDCHGVGETDASPHRSAPPFRLLSNNFPMDALEEAFADGRIYSGHPDMPEFIATPQQLDAIIAYIASLQG